MNSVVKFFGMSQLSLKKDLMYRADFLLSLFVTPVILIVHYFVWKAVFTTADTVGGFTFTGMITYMVYGQLISIFIFNAASSVLQQKVQTGQLVEDLLKPVHPFLVILSGSVASRIVALFLEVIPLAFIAGLLFTITLPHGALLILFIVSLLLAFLLNFIMAFIVGLLSFWTVKVEAFQWLTWIVFRVFSGEFFPLSLFPPLLQSISHLLPFEYMRYRVALIAIQPSLNDALITISGQIAWLAILGAITYLLWRKVISNFTGAGG